MKLSRLLLALLMMSTATCASTTSSRPAGLASDTNPGTLRVTQLDGVEPSEQLELPLTHTDVKIEVSGFVASATVTQRYHNPFDAPIEALYTFPLPDDAAVDEMEMRIGERTIRGVIKRREEAREIYEQAREAGQRAALLEQERPNIFNQSVANILPGDEIEIKIRYVNVLKYAEGAYELVFPMVVGPRYIPGNESIGQQGSGWSPDTDVVPDASRITPPVLKPGERSGHDIALEIELDAGVPIQGLHATSHRIDVTERGESRRVVKLHSSETLPNKDFILRYEVAGRAPEVATIAHHDERGGFFTLLVQPQREVAESEVVPRELIFIVDTSGSMRGFPLERSKEAMERLINGMRDGDTFNVVRFAGDTGTLWSRPKPYNRANAREALSYVSQMRGSGGTEMRRGIIDALAQPAADGALRIAFLLTDGYVGDEQRIFEAIEKERRGARVFSLGVGSSVNRYLLDRAASVGRGEAFYVRQDEDSREVIDRFFKRVDRPALAHIEIDWGGLDVKQLYPARIPDLWAGQPIRIHGRYQRGGEATVTIRGQLGRRPYEQKVRIALPRNAPEHAAMASVWGREKVRELMLRMVREGESDKLKEAVTEVGLEFRLMTQWTSFVAVEERVVNEGGELKRVVQPVELPEGVSYEGVFGEQQELRQQMAAQQMRGAPMLRAMPQSMIRSAPKQATRAEFGGPMAVLAPSPTADSASAPAEKAATVESMSCQLEALAVSGGLRYPEVRQLLESALPQLCRLFAQHGFSEALTEQVMLKIDHHGEVQRLRFQGAPVLRLNRELAHQFEKALKALRFSAVSSGEIRFVIRL